MDIDDMINDMMEDKPVNLVDALVKYLSFVMTGISALVDDDEIATKLFIPYMAKLVVTTRQIGELYDIDIEKAIEQMIQMDMDDIIGDDQLKEHLFEGDPLMDPIDLDIKPLTVHELVRSKMG